MTTIITAIEPSFAWVSYDKRGDVQTIDDMDIAGFRLHPLKGELRGRWSVSVNVNRRVTFEFRDSNAYIVDYEDYY